MDENAKTVNIIIKKAVTSFIITTASKTVNDSSVVHRRGSVKLPPSLSSS